MAAVINWIATRPSLNQTVSGGGYAEVFLLDRSALCWRFSPHKYSLSR
jgi:hypothetical protein